MLYRYAWVKAMTSPALGEFAVVGLVVGREKDWRVLDVGDEQRAIDFCGPLAVQAARQQLQAWRTQGLDVITVAQALGWQHSVQLSSLQTVLAEDLDDAVNLLLPVLALR